MTTEVAGGLIQFYLHESGLNGPISATRLSDGTIRFVAILALHPDAMALLAELLAQASERMQILVVTHSDALISELTDRSDAVVVCEHSGAGTELQRLDPERLAFWLKDYQLGDLWRIGELGANP